MAIIRKASGRKPGDVFIWPADSTPAGAMACPVAPTNVSRAAYPKLFKAIGTKWGAGDGATTFGIPYVPVDRAILAASGNIATVTIGVVIQHDHGIDVASVRGVKWGRQNGGGTGYESQYEGGLQTNQDGLTNYTGGGANIAAGVRMKYCVQYA